MWFENLTGFREENPEQVCENLVLVGNNILSKVNGKKYCCGNLEIPTLENLRFSSPSADNYNSKISVSEVVGNVQQLHREHENMGAVFQAASQFNLLEMVSPNVIPERGVGIYENDKTQGPACAISCGAGTIFRNYFVKINDKVGQSVDNQIDCLDEIGVVLGNTDEILWEMKNGYALLKEAGLIDISRKIKNLSSVEYQSLKGKLKVGVQWDTEVIISPNQQKVTQVYCSALPVAYSSFSSNYWEEFAKLILEATYEATFYVALKNYQKTGANRLFLTLVGGGVFGNEQSWIFDAIEKSILKFRNTPLDVRIVSYGLSNPDVKKFAERMNKL